jgi:hypothetical protein
MRNARLYGLFERVDGKWVRLMPALAFPKPQAVRVFQNSLLAPYLGYEPCKGPRELRPVKPNVCQNCGSKAYRPVMRLFR